ncbi:hypothetical protein V6N11_072906 [Hibiscus sabdariffa]|uniref:Retrotransposon gag domain-containing protein n=1 Tax=Hibiscus sabdariffa TaxID=183260 RepID=A0ABR2P0Z4_9ROSI
MDQLCLESSRKYLGAVSMLYGNVYTWWESVASSVPADRLTWEFFKEHFRSCFIVERYMREMRQRFQNLVQGGRTVSEYENEFLSLLRYGSSLVPTEKDKCRKFALGLRYELCKQVIPFQDDVFDILVGRAKDIEEIELLSPASDSADRDWFDRPIIESSSHPDKRTRMAMSQRSNSGPILTTSLTPIASRDISHGCTPLPICLYCGNRHMAECRKMKGACFRCGSLDHLLRDYPHPQSVVCTSA